MKMTVSPANVKDGPEDEEAGRAKAEENPKAGEEEDGAVAAVGVNEPGLVGEHNQDEGEGRNGEANNEEGLLREGGSNIAGVGNRVLGESMVQRLRHKNKNKNKSQNRLRARNGFWRVLPGPSSTRTRWWRRAAGRQCT